MLYSPLHPPENAIRLLKLHKIRPALPESPNISQPDQDTSIECTLFHVLRSEKPKYKALSYAWGNDTDPFPICVNSVSRHVGVNLKKALEHIRSEDEDLVLWIDALCINQQDASEKSEQVKRMADIYRNAVETIVWLGPANISTMSDDGMEYLDTLGKFVEEHGLRSQMLEMVSLASHASERSNAIKAQVTTVLAPFVNLCCRDVSGFLKTCHAMREISLRPYWERVWILQEYALASALTIRCGTRTVSFERCHASIMALSVIMFEVVNKLFASLTERMGRGELVDSSERHAFVQLGNLFPDGNAGSVQGIRSRYQSSPQLKLTLLRLLARAFVERTAGAKEPKDRVFAFLGMTGEAEELGIVPDYTETRTYQDVYSETARAIASIGQVDVLAFAQNRGESQNDLPSWVPDWSRSHDGSPEPILRPCGQLPWDTCFNASFGAAPFAPHPLLTTLPRYQLPLYGYTIDSIEVVGSAWQPGYDEGVNEATSGLGTYLKEIADLCDRSDRKLAESGDDCYGSNDDDYEITGKKLKDKTHYLDHPRTTARYLIPTADMQQYSMGFIQRADSAFSRRGYNQALGLEKHPGRTQSDELGSYYQMVAWQRNRRAYLGEKGTVGLAPDYSEYGDRVVVFCGGRYAYVLRKRNKCRTDRCDAEIGCEVHGGMKDNEGVFWAVVGEAYAHGFMYGEYFRKERMVEEFILV
ncbi:HET-domain-containing protein [Lindgomyces ingoldianus]|uniref:HET-domain-containing protein n=1 Tax=Lindgomyces ingoldianus TaxID=673940 RepID=A0ACB6RAJ3_9PLEO|nr:HET-domain-containing protein [Lindgomyces ingoldianus]KAF2476343.1 HET-domain-containing protein [Lindgomyces ingoldianus]